MLTQVVMTGRNIYPPLLLFPGMRKDFHQGAHGLFPHFFLPLPRIYLPRRKTFSPASLTLNWSLNSENTANLRCERNATVNSQFRPLHRGARSRVTTQQIIHKETFI